MNDYGKHYSVLKKEIIEMFQENSELVNSNYYGDLTFGAGGHTFAMCEEITNSKLICFDQDKDAFKNGLENISKRGFEDKVNLINKNFNQFENSIEDDVMFAGVLLDAGVSSHQFDTAERGFSFRFDSPLDMRMNQDGEVTAKQILNEYTEAELKEILYKYGEEKFTNNIVRNILEKRAEKPLETTKELEDICFHSYPKKLRKGKAHPATKTFQALRIEVNKELDVLSDVIAQVIPKLEVGGLFAIISFHSLEDRIVKHAFKAAQKGELPVEIVTKRPIIPSDEEIFENSRSRSAKLRVLKRVEHWPTKNKYPRK
jgi:16S rRNA (cytosine1402-N4)-methyltransferase